MPSRDIVVVGASAGGVEPLIALARALPGDVKVALFAVLHLPPHSTSVLPLLLQRAGALPAAHARAGEQIRHGRWYVAPPDHHLLIAPNDTIHLGRGPTENGHRPAVDPLFRSAAHAYGPRVVGVVLSGSLDDGTAGLVAIKLAGGVALVQDPLESLYPSMPQSALANVAVDHVMPVQDIAVSIKRMAKEPIPELIMDPEAVSDSQIEATIAEGGAAELEQLPRHGMPSAFACPDCHGVLWELRDGELVRYRCRVGHAYLPQALSAAQSNRLEESLWIALRTLKENHALSKRLAARARERRMVQVASAYEERAIEAAQRAAVIDDVLKRGHLSAFGQEPVRADTRTVLPDDHS